jgi:hypothetical protein
MKLSEKINTLIAIFTVITTMLSTTVVYLGYRISTAVELRNQHSWEITKASQQKEFWEEIASVETSILEEINIVGKDISSYVIASTEIVVEISNLLHKNKSIKIDANNIQLSAKYLNFMSSYFSLQSSTLRIQTKYQNSILIYSPMISALEIKGWKKYLNQGDEINEWQTQTMKIYTEFFHVINNAITTGIVPKNFEDMLEHYGNEMGQVFAKLTPPSLVGIHSMKAENYPNEA